MEQDTSVLRTRVGSLDYATLRCCLSRKTLKVLPVGGR